MSDISDVDILLNIENMIKTHVTSLERLKIEIKKHTEEIEDAFSNDSTYKTHAEEAKKTAKQKSQTKQEIMKNPSVAVLVEKMKEARTQVKELNGALSDYLREYARLSGSTEIADNEGNIWNITYSAKLVKAQKK
ncbi:hypothetical protein A3D77_03465 [Candidatus Gottesmanbacteria bacterium RIFCSPHIGHO2_02_FULL_39_11]|uniref:Uncharacterized protein n=1 Tax=Candidatus Gottesmanbacteria bacterium RIFCSPHIGHO2_02_FULL_39_11 TaxID=1798382 RepID=A0A1F5ZN57_9BACT|nr:MAG: hypothetical protein A3D77_03465 [Candidatus Gottesmanbacteria bacterium RIFCSPHIGHO2_02_FULL_39_11]